MVVFEVAFGAGIGAVMRYAITLLGKKYWPTLPFATMVINFFGALAAGIIAGSHIGGPWALFLLTGICGGFTTFSTFTADTFVLLRNQRWGIASLYYFGTILVGLVAVYAGLWLAEVM